MAVVMLGISQTAVAIIMLMNSTRGLRGDAAMVPFVCLAQMTDNGREVPLWALLVWPLVLPAEVLISAILAIAWATCAAGRVLNWKIRSSG